jgi:hypothetical protein
MPQDNASRVILSSYLLDTTLAGGADNAPRGPPWHSLGFVRPLVLITLRGGMFSDSMAWVVEITFRMSAG